TELVLRAVASIPVLHLVRRAIARLSSSQVDAVGMARRIRTAAEVGKVGTACAAERDRANAAAPRSRTISSPFGPPIMNQIGESRPSRRTGRSPSAIKLRPAPQPRSPLHAPALRQ